MGGWGSDTAKQSTTGHSVVFNGQLGLAWRVQDGFAYMSGGMVEVAERLGSTWPSSFSLGASPHGLSHTMV